MCRSLGMEEDMRDRRKRSEEWMRMNRKVGSWDVLNGARSDPDNFCSWCGHRA